MTAPKVPVSRVLRRETQQIKQITLAKAYFNGTRLEEITYPGMRTLFVRLESGTMPHNTLRGEAHVDVALDGRVLGMTIELADDE